jgi:hypothetical protein
MTESRNNFPNSEIGRELARKDAAKDIVDFSKFVKKW